MAYCILKSYKLNLPAFQVFEALNKFENCFFLDSSLNERNSGRYSFLGFEPFLKLKGRGSDIFPALRKALAEYSISMPSGAPPFLGGAIGYLAYDAGLAMEEKISRRKKKKPEIPDSIFSFYNTAIIIDRLKKRLLIFSCGFPERKHSLARALAETNFRRMHSVLCKAAQFAYSGKAHRNGSSGSAKMRSNFRKEEYISAVKKAKEYIRRGDIYQVNLSQSLCSSTGLSGQEIYFNLRRLSPSCFGAYFDAGDFQILSSSPERFLSLKKDKVATRPMKGTRPRGASKGEDVFFQKQLLGSAKDRAELTMIVDLERNDLGKVCSYDSIEVTSLRKLEKYSTVFQTTANIEGRLYEGKDRIDLLRACFPGGSITGCPKIRAMEIIEELEPDRRSIYTGALGYLSFSGNMDFNILIRTVLKQGSKVSFGVGGGIVADSDPEAEYGETLAKAKAMIAAIS